MSNDYHDTRREYDRSALSRSGLARDPFQQFALWLDAATTARVVDATAMTLATAGADGAPHARIVLMKAFDERGFVFYTDYDSEKGQDLAVNPQAELLFYWREFERQVRIFGSVTRTSDEESRRYFASRPAESRASAIVSRQSHPVASRSVLESAIEQIGSSDEKPDRWGGYRLEARRFEFWQGRNNRLHDRFRYSQGDDGWRIERLQP